MSDGGWMNHNHAAFVAGCDWCQLSSEGQGSATDRGRVVTTPQPLTGDELAAIKARAEAAETWPSPWSHRPTGGGYIGSPCPNGPTTHALRWYWSATGAGEVTLECGFPPETKTEPCPYCAEGVVE